jgi:predicted nucleic acid-binding protein
VRAVFDTNVVVAGIVAEGLCREILEIHVPEHTAILSQVLWDELVVTLRRKSAWCEPAMLAEAVCRDPDDDWVLATALAGEADAIVRGDADLLTLDSYSGIEMLSPRQFVSRQGPSGRG